ncbi:uncharacterized protein PV07_00852 [Cladophialophora immunda]|uniref:VOC domain-containing protein n=1 Tax=Cladophialophora immunda TaxID=569365 RepID=A0A0D2CW46_9EURO|nr:uncharacterized protein PV07_00852 [Cladophialophora immunda]KIW34050.1 hypothetical protein PV07_00852 [Cladophialophora immunda]OQV03054.1 hypothetical protein CLAIMM_08152 [Cladophialophora immunda]
MSDFDHWDGKVLSPTSFAHVVLRTGNLKKMRDFYIGFLGGRVAHENEFICFITYDEEHHRIAFIGVPGTSAKVITSCGLEHIAYSYPSLRDLLLSYRQRQKIGIQPHWCVNHGPTTSIYYKDPDGNMLETQVDNFDTAEAADEFIKGPLFGENPIGTDFDPEELIQRMQNGESDKDLKTRIEIGPRALRTEVPA